MERMHDLLHGTGTCDDVQVYQLIPYVATSSANHTGTGIRSTSRNNCDSHFCLKIAGQVVTISTAFSYGALSFGRPLKIHFHRS
jgi:hypothetical protein